MIDSGFEHVNDAVQGRRPRVYRTYATPERFWTAFNEADDHAG